jgi:hypothetical protein
VQVVIEEQQGEGLGEPQRQLGVAQRPALHLPSTYGGAEEVAQAKGHISGDVRRAVLVAPCACARAQRHSRRRSGGAGCAANRIRLVM